MEISILGSGSWGTAIASVLAYKGYNVRLWCYLEDEYEMFVKFHEHKRFLPNVILPDNVTYTMDIKDAVKSADMIVVGTPSFAVRSTVEKFKDVYEGGIVVSIAKGFENNSLLCLSQVIAEELGSEAEICVLSGPSHAEEVGQKMPTTLVAAAKSLELAQKTQDVFMCDFLRVYTSTDIIGVQLGAALKNVISLCAGIVDGLGYGDNLKAALMTRGIAEIIRLGVKMGGKAETFAGLSGIGDLFVTCASMHSRNRRAGILIGQGKSPKAAMEEIGMVVEGIIACESAYRLAQKFEVKMPIVEEAYNVLYKNSDIKNSMKNLMLRDKRSEQEIQIK